MTATKYLRHKYALLYTTRIISKGKMFAVVDGKEIPEKEFKAMHRTPDRLYAACEANPDRTRII